MLVPVKPKLLLALLAASLPTLSVAASVVVFAWWAGGVGALGRVVSAAGPYALLGVVVGVALMLVASALLLVEALGQRLPLLLLLGPPLLPWLLGLAGAKGTLERLVDTLPPAVGEEALAALAGALGESLVERLVGTGLSAALLVGVAVALLLVRREPPAGSEPCPGQRLGAMLGLVLGWVGLLVALELHQLFELLTALPHTSPLQRQALLSASTQRLLGLHSLHLLALGLLALLALLQLAWGLMRGPQRGVRWVGSLALVAVVAVVLGFDIQPLAPSEQGLHATRLLRSLLPAAQSLPLDPLGLAQPAHGADSSPSSHTML